MADSTVLECQSPDVAARLRSIKNRLPGQLQRERLETARALYGPLYSLAEIRGRVAETLPWRAGFFRSAALTPIEEYTEHIPDEALLKYDDAVQSGLFSSFSVVTPVYYRERQLDPWIIGRVAEADWWAVFARWE